MKKNKLKFFIHLLVIPLFLSCDLNFETLKIISFSPANNERGVAPGAFVEIVFSSPVDRTDVEESFALKNSEGNIEGSFDWVNPASVRYTPSHPMIKNGRYTMALPRSIRDHHGNIMAFDFISEFYVGTDFTAPVIVSSNPPSGAGAVSGIQVKQQISVSFSKTMNRESVERGFSITPDISGYFIWSEDIPGLPDSRLVFNPTGEMAYGKLYSFKVSGAVEDSAGNPLGDEYRVNFITGDDRTPPQLISISEYRYPDYPWSTSVINHVSRRAYPCLMFSEPMDRQSVEKAFTIIPSVQGIFEWSSDTTVIFRPLKLFDPITRYQVAIDTSSADLCGHKLTSRYSVEIITDAPDSLYVRCVNVRGSNYDGDYVSLPDTWPRIIDMGTGSPVNRRYFIMIDFISDEIDMTPAQMEKYSIFDNIMIETFKTTSGGEFPSSAYIGGIEWRSGSTALIEIAGMTNKSSGGIPALYRLTISGGENGIMDMEKNFMKDDFVMEFREAMP